MTEHDKPFELESAATESRPSDERIPAEPFACPACGQLLAPSCRVCVACNHIIDPAEIGKGTPAAVVGVAQSRSLAPVRFPWLLFASFLLALMVGGIVSESLIGPLKTQLLVGAFQLLCAIWVSFDAYAKRIPKPLRWGLAALFPTWLVILPWYLARRRQPEAPCPFIEARVSPVALVVLFILLAVLFYVVLKQAPPPYKISDFGFWILD
jgi:hypothetical protein